MGVAQTFFMLERGGDVEFAAFKFTYPPDFGVGLEHRAGQ